MPPQGVIGAGRVKGTTLVGVKRSRRSWPIDRAGASRAIGFRGSHWGGGAGLRVGLGHPGTHRGRPTLSRDGPTENPSRGADWAALPLGWAWRSRPP